jgi:hypothetical protein
MFARTTSGVEGGELIGVKVLAAASDKCPAFRRRVVLVLVFVLDGSSFGTCSMVSCSVPFWWMWSSSVEDEDEEESPREEEIRDGVCEADSPDILFDSLMMCMYV